MFGTTKEKLKYYLDRLDEVRSWQIRLEFTTIPGIKTEIQRVDEEARRNIAVLKKEIHRLEMEIQKERLLRLGWIPYRSLDAWWYPPNRLKGIATHLPYMQHNAIKLENLLLDSGAIPPAPKETTDDLNHTNS